MKFAIIFDLDGTLWDPSDVAFLSWKKVLERELPNYNITKEKLQSVTGMTTEDIGTNLFPFLDIDKRNELVYKCIIGQNDIIREYGGIIYDDVINDLEILSKDYDLYIVSNCQKGYIESFLDYYNLNNYIKDIECYGNNGLDKKDNIKVIIDRNNIKSSVYAGDTLIDYNSSKYNNIPFIYCSYGFGNLDNYDYKIDKFSELKDIIKLVVNN